MKNQPLPRREPKDIASRQEVETFIGQFEKFQIAPAPDDDSAHVYDRMAIRKQVLATPLNQLQAIARRILSDLGRPGGPPSDEGA